MILKPNYRREMINDRWLHSITPEESSIIYYNAKKIYQLRKLILKHNM